MKIKSIQIENFRLLKDFRLDLEDELSLVIGKNNSGKTSILTALNKFLNSSDNNKLTFNDFNIDFKKELIDLIESNELPIEDTYSEKGIKLKLFIEYYEADNLCNINKVMMDLDPENNTVVLGFEYVLSFDKLMLIKQKYREFKASEILKTSPSEDGIIPKYKPKEIKDFLNSHHQSFFKFRKKSIEFNNKTKEINESNFIDLEKESKIISDIINFKFISAKRDVTNKDIDKTLSKQTSKIYNKTETDNEQNKKIEKFEDELANTDVILTDIYKGLFDRVIDKVGLFGGIKEKDTIIEIISTLQHRELLEGNTTVVYSHDANDKLPENYNGLGYMNLISMIFEIEILVEEFKKSKDENPSDINLLFIEEPEAHTHPQMQYVFIKNIKKLLKGGILKKIRTDNDDEIRIKRELQYIVSTHSSHIVAESVFDDIKYLKKEEKNSVVAKNLKSLENEYNENGEEQNYRFLKQYLTLNRAELFFADKAIFIEGDTERILLPAMMKKIDQEFQENPLLSQNISIIEVGAHSHIFEKFIDFIGLKKSLIITDIDSYYQKPVYQDDGVTQKIYKNGNPIVESIKCSADDTDVQYTSNYSLIYFHNDIKDVQYFKNLSLDWKILRKNKLKQWVSNRKGNLLIAYQTDEDDYCGRSFEDSFFHINKTFIIDPDNSFLSLTPMYLQKFSDDTVNVFDFAEKAVGSKPSLAIEILLNSKPDEAGNEFHNWRIPAYIKEALLWLKQN
jgi:putative ATP-dependent endonuclease of OLD family